MIHLKHTYSQAFINSYKKNQYTQTLCRDNFEYNTANPWAVCTHEVAFRCTITCILWRSGQH